MMQHQQQLCRIKSDDCKQEQTLQNSIISSVSVRIKSISNTHSSFRPMGKTVDAYFIRSELATTTLAWVSLAQANASPQHSPDSPLNVKALAAPRNGTLVPSQSFSVPSVETLRIPPWPSQINVRAAPRRPQDTMTVVQRVEHRAAVDAIITAEALTGRRQLRMCGREGT